MIAVRLQHPFLFATVLLVVACSGGGGAPSTGPAFVVPTNAPTAIAATPTSAPTAIAATPTTAPVPTPSAVASLSAETPSEADHLVDAIGMNTHFNYTGTPYVDDFSGLSALLIASGVRHIRDGTIPYDASYDGKLATLGMAGINHSIGFPLNAQTSDVTQALAQQAPYIDFVEPTNEADASGDANWVSDVRASAQTIFQAVAASGSGIPVLGPSLASPTDFSALGNVDAFSNDGNLHDEQCNANPGVLTPAYESIANATQLIDVGTTHPIWTTETGYNSDSTRPCSIPDAVTAKYDPRDVAERFLAGEPRIYFYEFSNEPMDPIFGGMGFVDSSGNPKPQYNALKSMIGLLSDRGAEFSPTSLAYSISGATQDLHHLLLQKRDGTYVLMLWLEVPGFTSTSNTNGNGTVLNVAAQNVTVTTARTNVSSSLYQYDQNSWQLVPTPLAPSSSSYSFGVGDSIEFLTFK